MKRSGAAAGPHFCGPGATARDRPRAADDRAGALGARRARSSCSRAMCRSCRRKPCRHWSIATIAAGAAATVVTAVVDSPHGYGRIVRSGERIARIVEERDASPAEREIREINSGIYAFASTGCSTRSGASRARTRSASTTCPDLVAIYRAARARGRNRDASPTRTRFGASTAAPSSRSEPHRETSTRTAS